MFGEAQLQSCFGHEEAMSRNELDLQVYAQRQASAKLSNESQTHRGMEGDKERHEIAHILSNIRHYLPF